MKSVLRIFMLVFLIAGLGWAAFQAAAPPAPPLAGFVPRGALLYLEARDFSSLLADWNASPEKKEWLQSADHSVFSRSALLLRLEKAQQQFAAAAGIPPDMTLLSEAAGKESALALYDIGKLEFLYITRISSGRSMQSALWQARTKFESRSAAGVPFFVHNDAESERTVAFAVTDEYLVLATREDLLASALSLLTGGSGQPVSGEQWFSKAVTAASREPGDLRMVLNLEKIVATPHFRTYWIERNVSELKQYSAGVSDLYRTGAEYREDRILLRASSDAAPARSITRQGAQAAGDLARFVPEDAGVYRAVANPTVDESLALLENKILSPQLGPAPVEKIAPGVSLGQGVTGSASDLETRIDEAPPERVAIAGSADALHAAIEKAGVQASLVIQSSRAEPAGAFVTLHSAIVFRAAADWDGDAVRAALVAALEPALSTSRLGVDWTPISSPGFGISKDKSGKGAAAVSSLDGLMPLHLVTRGPYLFVSNDAELLSATLARIFVRADTQDAAYLAGFNHSRERDNFAHLTRTLDHSDVESMGAPGAGAREPFFFSENIASISRSLTAVKSVSINVRDAGAQVFQTVTYKWAR
jgi:hypothetical protein